LLESKIQKLNNEQVVLGQKHEFEASDLKLENEQRVKSATENLALALQKVKILEKENSEYKAQVEQKDKELDAGKKKSNKLELELLYQQEQEKELQNNVSSLQAKVTELNEKVERLQHPSPLVSAPDLELDTKRNS